MSKVSPLLAWLSEPCSTSRISNLDQLEGQPSDRDLVSRHDDAFLGLSTFYWRCSRCRYVARYRVPELTSADSVGAGRSCQPREVYETGRVAIPVLRPSPQPTKQHLLYSRRLKCSGRKMECRDSRGWTPGSSRWFAMAWPASRIRRDWKELECSSICSH